LERVLVEKERVKASRSAIAIIMRRDEV